jgi:hypothetical protein
MSHFSVLVISDTKLTEDERGEMGLFGCASNEKDRDQWDKEFSDLIDGLPPETWLAVVDCHI